jgi:hypothetical protein
VTSCFTIVGDFLDRNVICSILNTRGTVDSLSESMVSTVQCVSLIRPVPVNINYVLEKRGHK